MSPTNFVTHSSTSARSTPPSDASGTCRFTKDCDIIGIAAKGSEAFNLLVTDVARSVQFATEVLGATSFYDDEDFAALRWNGQDFMFHADHAYRDLPLSGIVAGLEARGVAPDV